MSTPDPPLELQLASASPSNLDAGRTPATSASPGVTTAPLRHPAAPTFPDFDPATLTRVVQMVANDLFQAPPLDVSSPAAQASPSQAAPVAQTSPPGGGTPGAPGPSHAPTSTDPYIVEPHNRDVALDGTPKTYTSNPAEQTPPTPTPPTPPTKMTPTPPTPPTSFHPHAGEIPAVAGDEGPTTPQPASPWETTLPGTITPPAAPPGATPRQPTRGPGVPPADATNPFATAPSFDALFAPAAGFDFHVPLLESAPTTSTTPTTPTTTTTTPTTPTTPTTTAAPLSTPSAPGFGWEHNPVVSLGLQQPGTLQQAGGPVGGFDAYALREEFPILKERVHGGKRLVWLDNAATTQKPQTVIDRISWFYEHENSNIHRAAHALAARASEAYEQARESVRRFVNAGSVKEIVFVRGTTEGINFIAQSFGRRNIGAGDEILITHLEHHANIVPWQLLAKETGARLRVAPVDDSGQIILDDFERLLSKKTKIVSFPAVSNALGTVTPAKQMIDAAHRYGATVVLDAAQSVSHLAVDVQQLDCDFLVFSGHKVFAPTGIGAVYGKQAILDDMPPWQGGGNMIADVTFEKTVFQPAPARFEAGTGNIADAVGLGAALDWLTRVGLPNVERHEHDLLVYGTEQLERVPGLTIIGTAKEKAGVLSFTLAGHSTQDVSAYLDKHGVATRGGHHCAQPILRRFGLESTVRASLAPYNVKEDLDVLVDALLQLQSSASR